MTIKRVKKEQTFIKGEIVKLKPPSRLPTRIKNKDYYNEDYPCLYEEIKNKILIIIATPQDLANKDVFPEKKLNEKHVYGFIYCGISEKKEDIIDNCIYHGLYFDSECFEKISKIKRY